MSPPRFGPCSHPASWFWSMGLAVLTWGCNVDRLAEPPPRNVFGASPRDGAWADGSRDASPRDGARADGSRDASPRDGARADGGCLADSDCDDGLFCNGLETCNVATGSCIAGSPPCIGISDRCNEATDRCVQCTLDEHCDDGLFCNGQERCDPSSGVCSPGSPPCTDSPCNEATDRCVQCLSASDCGAPPSPCSQWTCTAEGNCLPQPVADGTPCDDGNRCTAPDRCRGGACIGSPLHCPLGCYQNSGCTGQPCEQDSDCADYCDRAWCTSCPRTLLACHDHYRCVQLPRVDRKICSCCWERP